MDDTTRLAVATDFNGSGGDPEEALRQIADAGFTHLHWCHQWNTDHLYSDWEIARIAGLLRRFGLKLLDIHGSDACAGGALRCWYSTDETYRRAGVELVLNRLRMHAMLRGEGTLMMHIPSMRADWSPDARPRVWRNVDALRRSLDEILPVARGLARRSFVGDSFFIYAAHLGIILTVFCAKSQDILSSRLHIPALGLFTLRFAVPILLSLTTAELLKRHCPRIYALLTGGR